jgi:hypothetical protein
MLRGSWFYVSAQMLMGGWFLFPRESCGGSIHKRHFKLFSFHPIRIENWQEGELSKVNEKTES